MRVHSLYIGVLAGLLCAATAQAAIKAGPNVIGRHHRLGPGSGGTVLAGAGLDYNFTTGQYFQQGAAPGVTVARASSKSCDDQAGNWTTVASNVLCSTNKGALIEEARTNLFLNSAAPVTQTIAVVNGSVYTASLIGTGTMILSGAGSGVVSQGNPVTFTAGSTSLTATIAGTGGVFVNAQVELGAFRTSPILTAGAVATRQPDNVTVTTPPAFGAAYTMFAQGTPVMPVTYPGNQNVLQTDAGDTQRLVQRRNGSGGTLLTTLVGGTGAGFAPAGVWAQGASGKLSSAVAAGDQASVFNGGTPGTAATATLPTTPTAVRLGSNAGGLEQWDGYLERIALWPTSRLPNATLQSLTQ